MHSLGLQCVCVCVCVRACACVHVLGVCLAVVRFAFPHFQTDGSGFVASISSLVVEHVVAIDVTRVRFPANTCLVVCCGAAGLCCWFGLLSWALACCFAA